MSLVLAIHFCTSVCKNELRATAYVPSAALIRPASVAPRDKAAQHNYHNGSTPLVARLFSLRKAYEKTDSPGLFGGRQPTARSRIALPGFLRSGKSVVLRLLADQLKTLTQPRANAKRYRPDST